MTKWFMRVYVGLITSHSLHSWHGCRSHSLRLSNGRVHDSHSKGARRLRQTAVLCVYACVDEGHSL